MAKPFQKQTNLSRIFATFSGKTRAFQSFPKASWKGLGFNSRLNNTSAKHLFNRASTNGKSVYMEKPTSLDVLFFNCQKRNTLRAHPERSSSEVSRGTAPKALRDSRHLKKRFVPPTFFHPSVSLRAVLVTSHNEDYVNGPLGSYRKVPEAPLIHESALCDILGAERASSGVSVNAPTLLISPLAPQGEK